MALMQKSRSEPNCQSKSKATFHHSVYPKRKSTGNLRQSISQQSAISRSTSNNKVIFDIPDVHTHIHNVANINT